MKTTKLTPNVIFKNEKIELNPGGNVEIFSKYKSFKKNEAYFVYFIDDSFLSNLYKTRIFCHSSTVYKQKAKP